MMTSVLRDSLGGNCKTVMIATVNAEAVRDPHLTTNRPQELYIVLLGNDDSVECRCRYFVSMKETAVPDIQSSYVILSG